MDYPKATGVILAFRDGGFVFVHYIAFKTVIIIMHDNTENCKLFLIILKNMVVVDTVCLHNVLISKAQPQSGPHIL